MPVDHGFLVTFAVVLCTAAVTTVVFERLKQPVILGYLLAGLLIGPHVTFVPVVADNATTGTLAELGVILLLFAIGLEFSVRRLLRVGGQVAVTAVIDVSLMAWLGLVAARLMGFTPREALFTAAITAISSTTIIAKTFEDTKVGRRLRELVFGVLIVEDLFAVLFLAGLATLGPGGGEASPMWMTVGRLVILLTIWVTAGLMVIPRLMRFVASLGRRETTLVASLGLCFAFALLAQELGYSVALGAFIAGSLISESGKAHLVMQLVRPVRDVFAAVFFVAVGMLIDPALVVEHWLAVVVLTAVVMIGKVIAVSSGAFLAGQGTQTSLRAGMSMAQIGEFSFIIASLGLSLGVVRDFLYPVAVAVSAITALTTPYLVRVAEPFAGWVDRRLPRPLQTYTTLYASWVEEMTKAHKEGSNAQRVRQLFRWLLLDAVVLIAITIGLSLAWPRLRELTVSQFGIPADVAQMATWVLAFVLGAPFVFGIFRVARGLAVQLARMALPQRGRLDLAAAPRRALVVTLEIGVVLLVGVPIVVITQPFLPPLRGALVLLAVLLLLGVAAWRSATNLQGHVAAGSEVLLSALRSRLPPEQATTEQPLSPTMEYEADRFATATHLLPGMGTPQRFVVEEGHFGAGKSLAELALRGRTGATVLVITRGEEGIPAPSKAERLLPGDQLVLVGTRAATEAARHLLIAGDDQGRP